MGFGGFHPFPMRMGGGEPNLRPIYESLNLSLGPAYDTSDLSNVTAETMAEARALDAVYSANRRMALQWDPARMTDFLSRWEKIFDIHPGVNDTIPERRTVLESKFLALVGPATIDDAISALIGDCFIEVIHTPAESAYMRWPENGYPDDWTSHTAHILVRVQFDSNQTQSEFLKLMSKLARLLDDLLPSWCTWDWAMYNEAGEEGFFLDEPLGSGPPPTNLHYESFSPELAGRIKFKLRATGTLVAT